MTHDGLTSETPIVDVIQIIQSSPKPWPEGWHTWENTKRAFRQMSDEFAASLPGLEPTNKGEGRGIVLAGGGLKYFPSLWVLLNQLREVGCKLPIQLWHLGRAELDPAMRKLLEPFGVEFVDAREHEKKYPCRILNGWELKPYAVLHSRFRESLFLDADDTPLRDPSFLFDSEEYQQHGAAFWPDYPHWSLTPKHWERFGVEPIAPPLPRNKPDWKCYGRPIPRNIDAPLESGQFMVDKGRCWRELRLALWYCEHSDYCFSHLGQGDRLHGDKETFHLAWRKLKTTYAMPSIWPDWDTHTMFQHGFDHFPLFLHRTQDKWQYDPSKNRHGEDIPGEDKLFEIARKLPTVWGGRIWENSSPTKEEQERMARLAYRAYSYQRIGLDNGESRTLRLAPDGMISEGRAHMEQRWSLWSTDHGEELSICGADGLTCILQLCTDNVWRGRWEIHEKCEVELRPVKTILGCQVKETGGKLFMSKAGA